MLFSHEPFCPILLLQHKKIHLLPHKSGHVDVLLKYQTVFKTCILYAFFLSFRIIKFDSIPVRQTKGFMWEQGVLNQSSIYNFLICP
jgi:hypothetical protein